MHDALDGDEGGCRLVVSGFDPWTERGVEALLAVGNGHVGTRAALEEGSEVSFPLTLIAGVYDPLRPEEEPPTDARAAPTLLALPDWGALRIWVGDEELRLDHGTALSHERHLDHRRGQTARRWRHRLPSGRLVVLASSRLASLADRRAMVQEVAVRLPDDRAPLRLAATLGVPALDRRVSPYLARAALEPPAATAPATIVVRGPMSGTRVALAQECQLAADTLHDGHSGAVTATEPAVERSRDGVTAWWEWDASAGVTYRWERLVALCTSLDVDEPRAGAIDHVRHLRSIGRHRIVADHRRQWHERWEAGAIEVEGDEATQRALHAAFHHLTMAGNPDDERVSVPPRGLNGERYRGHVLWDAEIYMLPYYTFTWPAVARAMVLYRHGGLAEARARARRFGYSGALFPWESAGASEGTPTVDRSPAGEEAEISTWRRAHHVSADVAYAAWQYWQVTGDDELFEHAGAELVLETARFWASRVQTGDDGRASIRGVMGPDEYHENVDDSAYTNWMAAHNLELGRRTAAWLRRQRPATWSQLRTAIDVDDGEIDRWAEVGDAIVLDQDPATALVEEFAGFFDLDDVDLRDHDDRQQSLAGVLGRDAVAKTQATKQADVVLLCHLLADRLGAQAMASNLDYYEPRCDHASSLSPSVYALAAARLGRGDHALDLLHRAASIDSGDNVASAGHGVHIANYAGLWQAVVFGAAGLRATADTLSFEPRLLPRWERLRIPLQWRRRRFLLSLQPADSSVHVVLEELGGGGADRHLLQPGERLVVGAPKGSVPAVRARHPEGWRR